MNIQEYYDLLDRHDWYYDFSDDHGVWNAGRINADKLASLATSQEKKQLLNDFHSHKFSGKPWGTEEKPKPERPKDNGQ